MENTFDLEAFRQRVVIFREQELLVDSDLAKILGTKTATLLKAVQKNQDRFPESFAFPAAEQELSSLIENGTLTKKQVGKRAQVPLLFTEPGAYMAAFVLQNEIARKLSRVVVESFLLKEQRSLA